MNFGIWKGHYELLDDRGNSTRLVEFRAVLSRRFLRSFSGLLVESPPSGIPEDAKVTGWWRGRTVTFEKQHKHLWVLSDSGDVLTFDQWAQRTHGSSLSFQYPAKTPPVTYAGILNDNESSLMGVWHLPPVHANLATGGSISVPESYGTFAMRREVQRIYSPQTGKTRFA